MLMRQLYLTKRGILAMERKALANQMASEGGMPHPSDNITRMADLTTCLKENAAEDHHVHRKLARAVFRGVSLSSLSLKKHASPYVLERVVWSLPYALQLALCPSLCLSHTQLHKQPSMH